MSCLEMEALRSCLPTWERSDSSTVDNTHIKKSSHPRLSQTTLDMLIKLISYLVESYRRGYPQFTALISTHRPFVLCRRFSRLRVRLLLLKQDKLSLLEQKLDEVDQEEA